MITKSKSLYSLVWTAVHSRVGTSMMVNSNRSSYYGELEELF